MGGVAAGRDAEPGLRRVSFPKTLAALAAWRFLFSSQSEGSGFELRVFEVLAKALDGVAQGVDGAALDHLDGDSDVLAFERA